MLAKVITTKSSSDDVVSLASSGICGMATIKACIPEEFEYGVEHLEVKH